ncbi:hypothetical protein RchiOBHm_Chr1g0333141 [Rosa chinensis]|uniref:Uncharacterized protein n=1 Tax=Rosa chinensis TaxID=74649 RepID=A0A2P6SBY5_ROSCH|nr:uncharacterized protein LOC112204032 [Rosa chinensis]PRQ56198.1 hypothetical protein RchiOBHm_Chr1g0333141 [Rosa chinensis]
MERPEGYPVVDATEIDQPSNSGASFLGIKNDMTQLESGLLRRNYSDVGERNYYRFQSKVGKLVDPRLLALVEFFRELYFRRLELFKKIFPGRPDKFLDEMAKKLNLVLSQVKSAQTTRARTMQRSLSISSPREFKRDESEMRLERFKVRTIDVDDGVKLGGQDDKTKSAGSK